MAFQSWDQHWRRYYTRRRRCKPYHYHSPKVLPSRVAVFSASGCLSPWVPKLLLLGGDIELNPGPPKYICRICKSIISKRQTSVQCNSVSKHWIHSKCSGILLREYSQSYLCPNHSVPTSPDPVSTSSSSTTSPPASPDNPSPPTSPAPHNLSPPNSPAPNNPHPTQTSPDSPNTPDASISSDSTTPTSQNSSSSSVDSPTSHRQNLVPPDRKTSKYFNLI